MSVLLTAVLGLIGLLAVLMLWVVFGGDPPPRRPAPTPSPEPKPDTAETPKTDADSPAGES